MMSFHKHVKNLFDQELYSNVVTLAPMVITISDNNFSEYITPQETFQVYCYYADSLYHMHQYRKAESVYRRAIQLRKSILKTRGGGKPQEPACSKDWQSDTEIKYKMHICYVHMKQTQSSIDILQSIPAKQRSAKIYMCLGQAYERGCLARPAAAAYREALRVCPLALEAAERLFVLAVRPLEVLELMTEGLSGWEGGPIMAAWVNACAQAHSRKWAPAVRALEALDAPGAPLRGCPTVLVTLAEILYWAGDYALAITVFQRAFSREPLMSRGLGAYAACLTHEGHFRERGAPPLMPWSQIPPSEYTTEEWIALAQVHAERLKLPRAAYFLQKACLLEPRNVEALLLKGKILLGMKKFPEALAHFREAVQGASWRHEAYAGLVDSHLALRRVREAVAVAVTACKQLPLCPRSLTLYANVLLREGATGATARAKTLLERALALDENHLMATLSLARVLDTEEDSQMSIDLLEKRLAVYPNAEIHQALGELWARRGGAVGAERALQHYGAALALEPGCRRALDALARLDRAPPAPQPAPTDQQPGVEDADTTYELVTDGNVPSDTSNGPEESETEAVWSDMDLEVP